MIAKQFFAVLAFAVATAPAVFGGRMMIQFSSADSSVARAESVALAFRSVGCHDPAGVAYSATAEGMVAGKRESVALSVKPVDASGAFVIKREWPAKGQWVVVVNATEGDMQWSAVVRPEDPLAAKHFLRPATASDAETVLHATGETLSSK